MCIRDRPNTWPLKRIAKAGTSRPYRATVNLKPWPASTNSWLAQIRRSVATTDRVPAHHADRRAVDVQASGHAGAVSYTHLRAHETVLDLVCRLLLEKKTTLNHYNTTHS